LPVTCGRSSRPNQWTLSTNSVTNIYFVYFTHNLLACVICKVTSSLSGTSINYSLLTYLQVTSKFHYNQTILCNSSHSSGLPPSQKHAFVSARLKKITMDLGDLNSYWPISNLSFVSKLVERSVATRFVLHRTTYFWFDNRLSVSTTRLKRLF